MPLPISEEKDRKLAPKRIGIYPPIDEPIVIPNITKTLLDINLFLYESFSIIVDIKSKIRFEDNNKYINYDFEITNS